MRAEHPPASQGKLLLAFHAAHTGHALLTGHATHAAHTFLILGHNSTSHTHGHHTSNNCFYCFHSYLPFEVKKLKTPTGRDNVTTRRGVLHDMHPWKILVLLMCVDIEVCQSWPVLAFCLLI